MDDSLVNRAERLRVALLETLPGLLEAAVSPVPLVWSFRVIVRVAPGDQSLEGFVQCDDCAGGAREAQGRFSLPKTLLELACGGGAHDLLASIRQRFARNFRSLVKHCREHTAGGAAAAADERPARHQQRETLEGLLHEEEEHVDGLQLYLRTVVSAFVWPHTGLYESVLASALALRTARVGPTWKQRFAQRATGLSVLLLGEPVTSLRRLIVVHRPHRDGAPWWLSVRPASAEDWAAAGALRRALDSAVEFLLYCCATVLPRLNLSQAEDPGEAIEEFFNNPVVQRLLKGERDDENVRGATLDDDDDDEDDGDSDDDEEGQDDGGGGGGGGGAPVAAAERYHDDPDAGGRVGQEPAWKRAARAGAGEAARPDAAAVAGNNRRFGQGEPFYAVLTFLSMLLHVREGQHEDVDPADVQLHRSASETYLRELLRRIQREVASLHKRNVASRARLVTTQRVPFMVMAVNFKKQFMDAMTLMEGILVELEQRAPQLALGRTRPEDWGPQFVESTLATILLAPDVTRVLFMATAVAFQHLLQGSRPQIVVHLCTVDGMPQGLDPYVGLLVSYLQFSSGTPALMISNDKVGGRIGAAHLRMPQVVFPLLWLLELRFRAVHSLARKAGVALLGKRMVRSQAVPVPLLLQSLEVRGDRTARPALPMGTPAAVFSWTSDGYSCPFSLLSADVLVRNALDSPDVKTVMAAGLLPQRLPPSVTGCRVLRVASAVVGTVLGNGDARVLGALASLNRHSLATASAVYDPLMTVLNTAAAHETVLLALGTPEGDLSNTPEEQRLAELRIQLGQQVRGALPAAMESGMRLGVALRVFGLNESRTSVSAATVASLIEAERRTRDLQLGGVGIVTVPLVSVHEGQLVALGQPPAAMIVCACCDVRARTTFLRAGERERDVLGLTARVQCTRTAERCRRRDQCSCPDNSLWYTDRRLTVEPHLARALLAHPDQATRLFAGLLE